MLAWRWGGELHHRRVRGSKYLCKRRCVRSSISHERHAAGIESCRPIEERHRARRVRWRHRAILNDRLHRAGQRDSAGRRIRAGQEPHLHLASSGSLCNGWKRRETHQRNQGRNKGAIQGKWPRARSRISPGPLRLRPRVYPALANPLINIVLLPVTSVPKWNRGEPKPSPIHPCLQFA